MRAWRSGASLRRLEAVLVEQFEQVLPDPPIESGGQRLGEVTGGDRQAFDIDPDSGGQKQRERNDHGRPRALHSHDPRGTLTCDRERGRQRTLHIGDLERLSARQAQHPRRLLERFGDGDLRKRHALERAARHDHQRVPVDTQDHDVAGGRPAVEAGSGPAFVHKPMSSPNASTAASPAAGPGAAIVDSASVVSGSSDSTRMHSTR